MFKLGLNKIILGVVGGVIIAMSLYIWYLRSENETLTENNIKLEDSIESQKEVIKQKTQDMAAFRQTISQIQRENRQLSTELDDTRKRFNKISSDGRVRDIGVLARAKPKLVEKVINNAIVNANRCYEIAMGAELTEDEKNAEKRSQINPECTSIANPNYSGS